MNRRARKILFVFVATALLAGLSQTRSVAQSQNPTGTWKGTITWPGLNLPIEFDLSQGGGGTVKTPQPFTGSVQWSMNSNKLVIRVQSVNGVFSGTLNGNQANGTWTQNGMTAQLALSKSTNP
jgi:hypothetical protein